MAAQLRRWTRRIGLAAEVLLTYARVRRSLRERDLRRVLDELRGRSTGWRPADEPGVRAAGARVGRAVQVTTSALPMDARCLTQALVVTAMLARRDIPSTVVIAVRSPGETFGAHAWVELGGRALLPPAAPGHARLIEL